MKRHGSPIGSGMPRFSFPDGELETGALLGEVTDRSVRVWVRHPAETVEATLSVGDHPLGHTVLQPDAAHDHVAGAVIELDQARPGEEFAVDFGRNQVRRSRFAPSPGTRSSFCFVFGSCHQPFSDPLDRGRVEKHAGAAVYPRVRQLLRERGAAFALWLGDQVYSDAVSELSVRERLAENQSITDADLLETYRHLHRGYFNESGYRALNEAIATYLMWDDHDIFDGWGSLLDRTPFDERVFRAAETAFVEYQHLRNPTGVLSGRAPYDYSFWYGDVGFHVLDLRSERDFQRGQVMGEVGWERLEGFLAEASERDVRTVFIGLSVPLVHASPALMTALERVRSSFGRDVRDRWSVPSFAGQRTMLFERLFAWQASRPRRLVIVLSGDVHVGAAFGVRAGDGDGALRQWTSSALSTPTGLKHVLANRLVTGMVRLGEREVRVTPLGLVTTNNVGVVEVQPAADGGHVVRLRIHQYDKRSGRLAQALSDVVPPGISVRS